VSTQPEYLPDADFDDAAGHNQAFDRIEEADQ
jgi:hypothetical protein